MNSASEGGLARRVSMPSAKNQCNNDHTQTPELPTGHTDAIQMGHRFHFLARGQSHKPECSSRQKLMAFVSSEIKDSDTEMVVSR